MNLIKWIGFLLLIGQAFGRIGKYRSISYRGDPEKAFETGETQDKAASENDEIQDDAATGIGKAKDEATAGIDQAQDKAATGIDKAQDDAAAGIDQAQDKAATGIDKTQDDENSPNSADGAQAAQASGKESSDNSDGNLGGMFKGIMDAIGDLTSKFTESAKNQDKDKKDDAGIFKSAVDGLKNVNTAVEGFSTLIDSFKTTIQAVSGGKDKDSSKSEGNPFEQVFQGLKDAFGTLTDSGSASNSDPNQKQLNQIFDKLKDVFKTVPNFSGNSSEGENPLTGLFDGFMKIIVVNTGSENSGKDTSDSIVDGLTKVINQFTGQSASDPNKKNPLSELFKGATDFFAQAKKDAMKPKETKPDEEGDKKKDDKVEEKDAEKNPATAIKAAGPKEPEDKPDKSKADIAKTTTTPGKWIPTSPKDLFNIAIKVVNFIRSPIQSTSSFVGNQTTQFIPKPIRPFVRYIVQNTVSKVLQKTVPGAQEPVTATSLCQLNNGGDQKIGGIGLGCTYVCYKSYFSLLLPLPLARPLFSYGRFPGGTDCTTITGGSGKCRMFSGVCSPI